MIVHFKSETINRKLCSALGGLTFMLRRGYISSNQPLQICMTVKENDGVSVFYIDLYLKQDKTEKLIHKLIPFENYNGNLNAKILENEHDYFELLLNENGQLSKTIKKFIQYTLNGLIETYSINLDWNKIIYQNERIEYHYNRALAQ